MLVFGVELQDLPDGCMPIEVMSIVKALDEEGAHCLYTRSSDGLSPWERIGMLSLVLDHTKELAACGFDDPEWAEDVLEDFEDE